MLSFEVDFSFLEQPSRYLFFTGKGGVGKTTIAASVAAELASRGHHVHLSTTDPAAHVAAALAQPDNLKISRIDPIAETKAYVERVMARRGANLAIVPWTIDDPVGPARLLALARGGAAAEHASRGPA
jgi:cellulose biosynthesis protein BcsQ